MIGTWIYRMIRNFTIPMLVFIFLAYFTDVTSAMISAFAFILSNALQELPMMSLAGRMKRAASGRKGIDGAIGFIHFAMLFASGAFLFWWYGWEVGVAFIIAFIVYFIFRHDWISS